METVRKKTKMIRHKHRGFTAHKPVKTVKLNQERYKSQLRRSGGEEYLGGCVSLAVFRFKL